MSEEELGGYHRTASGKVQRTVEIPGTDWFLVLQAAGVRRERTGVHATISFAIRRGNGLTVLLEEDLFNVERREERNRLANAAVKSPLLPPGLSTPLGAIAQAEALRFARGLWDFEIGEIAITRRGGALVRTAPPWLLEPFILEKAGTILFAPPGRGKSYTGLIWAVCVDAGLSIEDRNGNVVIRAQRAAPTLFVNLERGAESVDQRLGNVNAALGLPRDRGLLRLDRRGQNLSDLLDAIEKAIVREGIELVILDSLTRGGFGDMNENLPANKAMDGLNRLGTAWVALAHTARSDESHVFGCYAADTDVLTRRGWLAHADVTLEDEVASFDPATETLRWDRPTHLHAYPYHGELLALGGQSQSLLVTPNHRMVHRARTRASSTQWGSWRFTEADTLPLNAVIPYATPFENARPDVDTLPLGEADVPADHLLRYLGWWVSEGSIVSHGAVLTQAAGPLADAMRATVEHLGFAYHAALVAPSGRGRRHVQQLRIRGAGWFADWLRATCGAGAAQKRLPALTWDLSTRQQRVMFEALVDGDGWRDARPLGKRRGGAGGAIHYATTSRQLADDVQRLAIELGHSASVRALGRAAPHHHDRYVVLIGNRRQIGLLARHRATQRYDGTVYCLTVPTGAYLTRREGQMAIAGNSQMFDAAADLMCQMLTQEMGELIGVGVRGTKANDVRNPPLRVLAYHFDDLGLDSVRAADPGEFLVVENATDEAKPEEVLMRYVLEVGASTATQAAKDLAMDRGLVSRYFTKSGKYVFVRKEGKSSVYAVKADPAAAPEEAPETEQAPFYWNA